MSRLRKITALAGALAALQYVAVAHAELKIEGLDDELEHNAMIYASLAEEPCDAEQWLVRRRFRSVEQEIREAMQPFGYYKASLQSTLSFDQRCWHATVTVDPGEPVRFRNVSIQVDGEARTDPAFAELQRSERLAPGQPARHSAYDNLKKRLQIRAADRGYVEAKFTESRLDIWPDEGVADAVLHFDSGPRYRIGKISQEQAFLDPGLVAAYLNDLETGAYYDNGNLAKAYRDLSDSGYFSRIEIMPGFDAAADGEIPIQVALQPGTRIEYTIGVGASTDTGFRFRAGYRNNRVNSHGHRVITDLNVSPVVQGLSAEYRIPLADPRREWFSFHSTLSIEKTDTFDNETQSIGIRWTRALSDTWLRTFSVDFNNESYTVGDSVDTRRSVVPAVALDHKYADRDIFPSRGERLGVELRGTERWLGSANAYVQTTAWARWIRAFGNGNRVLLRLNAGILQTDVFDQLPPSVRFFAGGDDSVRGFDYQSLGPKDADGNVIGGRRLLVGSVEYERHLKGNFYGAVFVDAGNAFDGGNFRPAVGTGPGIKWISPLGAIRLYIGVPLTGDDTGVRFHLRLGADL